MTVKITKTEGPKMSGSRPKVPMQSLPMTKYTGNMSGSVKLPSPDKGAGDRMRSKGTPKAPLQNLGGSSMGSKKK